MPSRRFFGQKVGHLNDEGTVHLVLGTHQVAPRASLSRTSQVSQTSARGRDSGSNAPVTRRRPPGRRELEARAWLPALAQAEPAEAERIARRPLVSLMVKVVAVFAGVRAYVVGRGLAEIKPAGERPRERAESAAGEDKVGIGVCDQKMSGESR